LRTVELGGSLTYLSTTYQVKALKDDVSAYIVSLSESEYAVTSWIEAKVKGQNKPLHLTLLGQDELSKSYKYQAFLPNMKSGDTVNILVETVQTHASHPWPASAPQSSAQLLRYYGDLFVISPYTTKSQKTKYRGVTQFLNYTIPTGLDDFTLDPTASRSGTTVTYGPFNDLPESDNREFLDQTQQRVELRYDFGEPVLTVTSLKRAAEISHWGSNLNIQDEIKLHNAGPTLKGQFSRVEYQRQKHAHLVPPSIVEKLTLHLPPGVHSPYFYDLNGNVSTSNFRPSKPPTTSKSRSILYSVLDIRPRFPILGGWNYNFTLGWDANLVDTTRFDKDTGRYLVGIPFWTVIPHTVVDDAEVSIILPEGATDVEIYPPFPPKTMERSTHITYLDTFGRPKITLTANQLTDRHSGAIYVSYKVPNSAHFTKPLAIAAGTFGVFALSFLARRIDMRIQK